MDYPPMVLVSPKGTHILGTLETLTGRAEILRGSVRQDPDGGFDFDYEGTTHIFWDDRQTVVRDGKRIFLDEHGNEFNENTLKLVSDDQLDSESHRSAGSPPRAITVTMEGGVIHGVEGIPDGVILRTINLDVEGADESRITTLANGEKAYVSEWGNEVDPTAPHPSSGEP